MEHYKIKHTRIGFKTDLCNPNLISNKSVISFVTLLLIGQLGICTRTGVKADLCTSNLIKW